MALAGPGRAKNQAAGTLVEPCVAGGERHHLGLGDHRHNVEVEIGQALARQQPGLAQMALDPASGPLGKFVLGKGGKEARRRPVLGIGPLGKILPELPHCRQTQFREHQGQPDPVGAQGRLTYTVYSATVNLAQRLETENKDRGTRLLACNQTVERAGIGFDWQHVGNVGISGLSACQRIATLSTLSNPD